MYDRNQIMHRGFHFERMGLSARMTYVTDVLKALVVPGSIFFLNRRTAPPGYPGLRFACFTRLQPQCKTGQRSEAKPSGGVSAANVASAAALKTCV
jgi:hypothetical protein